MTASVKLSSTAFLRCFSSITVPHGLCSCRRIQTHVVYTPILVCNAQCVSNTEVELSFPAYSSKCRHFFQQLLHGNWDVVVLLEPHCALCIRALSSGCLAARGLALASSGLPQQLLVHGLVCLADVAILLGRGFVGQDPKIESQDDAGRLLRVSWTLPVSLQLMGPCTLQPRCATLCHRPGNSMVTCWSWLGTLIVP
jgi:hypothetical protein